APPLGAAADVASSTGPLPSVEESPLEQGEEFLPIFASVESAWFRRPSDTGPQAAPMARTGADAGKPGETADEKPGERTGEIARVPRSAPAPGPVAAPQAQGGNPAGWRSRADSGFQAAASARDPLLGGVTAAGLPKRTPKANLVPGSVGADSPPAAPRPPVSADAVRSRLSSFQQGVRRGRAQTAGGLAEGSGKEEEGS
ncbi:hypothetical protein AB0J37_26865, partial [Microbispora rosea]